MPSSQRLNRYLCRSVNTLTRKRSLVQIPYGPTSSKGFFKQIRTPLRRPGAPLVRHERENGPAHTRQKFEHSGPPFTPGLALSILGRITAAFRGLAVRMPGTS